MSDLIELQKILIFKLLNGQVLVGAGVPNDVLEIVGDSDLCL